MNERLEAKVIFDVGNYDDSQKKILNIIGLSEIGKNVTLIYSP
jgi:hypothetical protein